MARKYQTLTARASAALPAAGAYDSAPTSVPVQHADEVTLYLAYAQGGAGGACALKIDVSPDQGTTWHALTVLDSTLTVSTPNATMNAYAQVLQFPAGSGNYCYTLATGGVPLLRVRAAETGNTAAPGTLSVKLVPNQAG